MTTLEKITQQVKRLPPEKQQAVLDFVELLRTRERRTEPPKSLSGIWKDFDVRVDEEDIAEARRETWGSSPRDNL